MSGALVFPDTRKALVELIDGTAHYDAMSQSTVSVRAAVHLEADEYGALLGPFPLAHIYGAPGGTIGYVDRVDRRVIDVYAPGEQAVNILESITAFVCGMNIEAPSGYLDLIECDVTPEEIPYESATLNKATATFTVTSRPVS